MHILVTGGAGYIGSHTALELLLSGHTITIADNFVNSKPDAIDRLRKLSQRDFDFIEADLANAGDAAALFEARRFDAVFHFAGLKAVGESVEKPLLYYENNMCCTLNLLRNMAKRGVNRFVFSSSATVYGDAKRLPITEDSLPLYATNPYGRTKLMTEEILCDAALANPALSVAILRYFNPVGADSSGLLGEDPAGIPNNLFPYIARVALGRLKELRVFGGDYPTPDGTGVRDYIHVSDLAKGHVAALQKLESGAGVYIYNLGTGKGVSVLEALRAFQAACGKEIPFKIAPRRPGDVAACWADPAKAEKELGWKAELGLSRMCEDAWRFAQGAPT